MLVPFLRLMLCGTTNLLSYAVAKMGAQAGPGTLFPPVENSTKPMMNHQNQILVYV